MSCCCAFDSSLSIHGAISRDEAEAGMMYTASLHPELYCLFPSALRNAGGNPKPARGPVHFRESLERNVDFSASTQTRHRSTQRTGSSLRRKHGQDGGESSPSPGRGAGAHQTTMHVCSRRHADATGNETGTEIASYIENGDPRGLDATALHFFFVGQRTSSPKSGLSNTL